MSHRQPPTWSVSDTLLHLTTHDLLVQAALLIAVAGSFFPITPRSATDLAFVIEVLPRVLLAVVVVAALGRGLGDLPSPDERAFWDDLLLAAGIFAAGLIAQMTGPWTGASRSMLAGRLLFTVSFAQLLLAVERRPDRSGPWRPRRMERRLALQAVAVLTVGLVIYFAILPEATIAEDASSRAAARIFSILGLLLLLRLVHLGATAPSRRWRLLYRVMSFTAGGLCLFYLQRIPPFDRWVAPWLKLFETVTWTVPLLAMVVAARLRHVPFPASWRPRPPTDDDDPDDPVDEIRAGVGTRTLILALAVPVLHHVGYLVDLFDPIHRDRREWWIVVWTLALGIVVFRQRQQLEGRLRRALGDQDRIERTLRASERRLKLADVRREADEALFASREKYAKAFRRSPFGLVITTRAEGRHVDCNDRYLEILGRPRQEVVGRTVAELGLFADLEAMEQMRVILRDDGRVERYPAILRRPNGGERRLRVSAERLALGDEPHDLAVIEDLTAEDLHRQDLRHRAGWVDAMAAGIIGLDARGHVTVWSPAVATLSGRPADEALDRPLDDSLDLVSPLTESIATWFGVQSTADAHGRPLRVECLWSRVAAEIDGTGGGVLIVLRRL
ncbi:MAG: PAS domain S-box protein [Acidobacteriota bacterium]